MARLKREGDVSEKSMDKFKEIVTWHIRKLDKVRTTLTMIVVEGL